MNRAKQHANKSDNWVTPQHVIDYLYGPKGPDLDVCATNATVARAKRFFTPEQDALTQKWTGFWWCNPPFSRCADFVEKAFGEAANGHGLLLLPANVGTAWFMTLLGYCENMDYPILFWPRRIQFLDPMTMQPSVNAKGKRSGNTGGTVIVAIDVPTHKLDGKGFFRMQGI